MSDPNPTTEHAAADDTTVLPWTAKMIAETHFTKVGRGGKFYDPAEVDPFVKRVANEIGWRDQRLERVHTENAALRQAKAVRHDPRRPSVMAVDAGVRAQAQAEDDLAAARREYQQTRARTAAMIEDSEAVRREADEYLRAARAIAETPAQSSPEARELPPEPQPTGDIAADVDARSQHLQECRLLLDQWRKEDEAARAAYEEQRRVDDQRRAALDDKIGRLVESLDQLETVMPTARARVVDLRDEIADATSPDVEKAAS